MTGGACIYSWARRGCFVREQHVHCGHHQDTEALAEFIATYGLDTNPDALTDEGWLHLVANLAGDWRIESMPGEGSCLEHASAWVRRRIEAARVELQGDRASIAIPVQLGGGPFATGDIVMLDVLIQGGQAQITRETIWSDEQQSRYRWGDASDDDVWGSVAG